jgi:hypothetical protein
VGIPLTADGADRQIWAARRRLRVDLLVGLLAD